MNRVKGFKASAFEANLRYKNRFDMGLIVADKPAAAAAVFTTSRTQAAPVIWSQEAVKGGRARAFLANAGQANAQTGENGLKDCRQAAAELAGLIGAKPEEVLIASTGVIGQPINMPPYMAALPQLADKLSETALDDFAQAIMTTDTAPKVAYASLIVGDSQLNIWGAAKGSGMIAPNMATMLGFILTDANLSPELLKALLVEGADKTFNRITVDGDTSTNDTVMMMASGAAGAPITGGDQLTAFRIALFQVMENLSRQIVFDGEGANHLVTIRVTGAADNAQAAKAARTVAESPLVKTAFFGRDANWGRILAALGRSGAEFDPYQVDIDLNDVPWIRQGLDNGQEEAAAKVMALREYTLNIDLKAGSGQDKIMTCDFSHEYVTINGSYRS